MNTAFAEHPALPAQVESAAARKAHLRLAPMADRSTCLKFLVRGSTKAVELPPLAVRILVDALVHLAKGNAVAVVPIGEVLSTQQAADLLGVSRPFLVELLESGRVPFHKVGTHRRVRLQDVTRLRTLISGAEDAPARSDTLGVAMESRRPPSGSAGLGRTSPRARIWTTEEIALLGCIPDGDVAAKYGVSVAAVGTRRRALGIPAHRQVVAPSPAYRPAPRSPGVPVRTTPAQVRHPSDSNAINPKENLK